MIHTSYTGPEIRELRLAGIQRITDRLLDFLLKLRKSKTKMMEDKISWMSSAHKCSCSHSSLLGTRVFDSHYGSIRQPVRVEERVIGAAHFMRHDNTVSEQIKAALG